MHRYEAALDEMERTPEGDFVLFADHLEDRKQRDEELRERLSAQFGALGLMFRENQGHEERAAENQARNEKGAARRLMHEGKARAFEFANANLQIARDAALSIFEEADGG